MSAWNGWYHVTGGTYGTWLRGDPRGWRDRKHRLHVEGDYRNPPPPGEWDALREHVRESLRQPPVKLDASRRRTAGQAMVERLLDLETEVLGLALDAVHYHILVRLPGSLARQLVGKAKKHAYHELVRQGHVGKVWAKRCRVEPVRDRRHQVNTYRYIAAHAGKGAWVWSFKQGLYWHPAKE